MLNVHDVFSSWKYTVFSFTIIYLYIMQILCFQTIEKAFWKIFLVNRGHFSNDLIGFLQSSLWYQPSRRFRYNTDDIWTKTYFQYSLENDMCIQSWCYGQHLRPWACWERALNSTRFILNCSFYVTWLNHFNSLY